MTAQRMTAQQVLSALLPFQMAQRALPSSQASILPLR